MVYNYISYNNIHIPYIYNWAGKFILFTTYLLVYIFIYQPLPPWEVDILDYKPVDQDD